MASLLEEMNEYRKKRGFGTEIGFHKITWDKDWNLEWVEMNGKIDILVFANEEMIRRKDK